VETAAAEAEEVTCGIGGTCRRLTCAHPHRTDLRHPRELALSYDHAQPEDDFRIDAFAAYARVDSADERLEIVFRRVPFDRNEVLAAIAASGIPHADALTAQWQPRDP
jgi:hypothetical protein